MMVMEKGKNRAGRWWKENNTENVVDGTGGCRSGVREFQGCLVR